MPIKLLVMDVDGTLTDGKIYMGSSGEMMKAFDVKDGYAIHEILPSLNIIPVIITGRKSQILENRCKELGITELHQGVREKRQLLKLIAEKYACELSEVAYIGDDLNDFSCMEIVKRENGLVGCPADAVKEVKRIADFVGQKTGGNGAVREFLEWIRDTK